MLFTECGFGGNAEAFSEHDSDLNDNSALVVGARGGFGVSVSSVLIIKDTESDGAEREQLLNRLNAIETQLNARIDGLLAKVDAHNTNIDGDLVGHNTALTDHDTALGAVAAQTASIFAHANPDPFEVTLQTCMSLEGGADIGLASAFEVGLEVITGFGIDFYGNGIRSELHYPAPVILPPPAPPVPLPILYPNFIALQSKVEASATLGTTACYEGVRVPFKGTFGTLQPDGTPKTHKAIEQAYIDSAESVAKTLQNPTLLDAIDSIGLDVQNMGTVIAGIVDLIPSGLELTDREGIVAIASRFTELATSLPLVGNLTFDVAAAEAALRDPCATLTIDFCQNPLNLDSITEADLFNTFNILNTLPGEINNLFNGATTFATNKFNEANALATSQFNQANDFASNKANEAIAGANSAILGVCSNLNFQISALSRISIGPVNFPGAVVVPRTNITVVPEVNITVVPEANITVVPELDITVVPRISIPVIGFDPSIGPFGFVLQQYGFILGPYGFILGPYGFILEEHGIEPFELLPRIAPFDIFAPIPCPPPIPNVS